jgi:Holliday junction resolvase
VTPEAKVKLKIHAALKAQGAYAVNYIGGLHANNGTPDILACLGGRFIGIEAKAGSNKPTDLQLQNLRRIDEAGGVALVINETNLELVRDIYNTKSNFDLFARPAKAAGAEGEPQIKRRPAQA